MNPREVLLVDDDPELRKIIASNLEHAGFSVHTASDGVEALAALSEQPTDIVILDVMMPKIDGIEATRRIRANTDARIKLTPIILLTARSEEADRIAGLEAGADDYVTKPFSNLELIARVRAQLRRVDSDAALSPTTRLPGNLFIEQELRRRIDSNDPFAVLYIDADHFKAYNDVYGFGHGDTIIRFIAHTIVDAIRTQGGPEDFVGHIGGDDFVAITQDEHVDAVATAILEAFDRGIRKYYNERDARTGYIETRDRRGSLDRFPIMTLSIAALSNKVRPLTDYGQIGEIAAELKSKAKAIPGSSFVKDRRLA